MCRLRYSSSALRNRVSCASPGIRPSTPRRSSFIGRGGDNFDLCPADAGIAQPGRAAIRMTAATPPPVLIDAAERIARAAGLDIGSVEVVIDDRDGTPRFYDINAMSNFVADPLNVLGWDPHERLIDFLETLMKEKVAA